MPLPPPAPGLVIRYSYLWRSEHLAGREEGVKDRPCAIILVSTTETGADASWEIVTVLPVTHSPPSDPRLAVELPHATKARLGLDSDRSWVVLTEANRFIWPGPDLRPAVSGEGGRVAYGLLPAALFEEIRRKFVAVLKAQHARVTSRTD